MKIGIMQPYLFPYIGYFQLMNYCDVFVLHDDVQYIKGGWINRNRILSNGTPKYINLPVAGGPAETKINQKQFTPDVVKHKKKLLRQIEGAYSKAPYFSECMAVLEACMDCAERNVSRFTASCLSELCGYAGISLDMRVSSQLDKNDSLRCQDRVIDMVRALGGDTYVNPIGGEALYDARAFAGDGLELEIISVDNVVYGQFGNDFVPHLSMVDVLMFNSPEETKGLLSQFTITKKMPSEEL